MKLSQQKQFLYKIYFASVFGALLVGLLVPIWYLPGAYTVAELFAILNRTGRLEGGGSPLNLKLLIMALTLLCILAFLSLVRTILRHKRLRGWHYWSYIATIIILPLTCLGLDRYLDLVRDISYTSGHLVVAAAATALLMCVLFVVVAFIDYKENYKSKAKRIASNTQSRRAITKIRVVLTIVAAFVLFIVLNSAAYYPREAVLEPERRAYLRQNGVAADVRIDRTDFYTQPGHRRGWAGTSYCRAVYTYQGSAHSQSAQTKIYNRAYNKQLCFALDDAQKSSTFMQVRTTDFTPETTRFSRELELPTELEQRQQRTSNSRVSILSAIGVAYIAILALCIRYRI